MLVDIIACDSLARLVIAKMLHDIASPLNAVMMGIDILESEHDASMVGYTKDGVVKMAALLALFRMLWNKDIPQLSLLDIKKNFSALCDFSINANDSYVSADIAQLIICTVYAILCATAKVKSISCAISNDKVQIEVTAQEIFCDFNVDTLTEKNIFQYVVLKLADSLNRRLSIQNELNRFMVAF